MKSFTSRALTHIIETEFSNQTAFAGHSGVERTYINRDLRGTNKMVSDERFKIYLQSVSKEGQVRLIDARIRDLVPEELHESLWPAGESHSPELKVTLSPELTAALQWLATELYKDPDLEQAFLTWAKWTGFESLTPEPEITEFPEKSRIPLHDEPNGQKIAESVTPYTTPKDN